MIDIGSIGQGIAQTLNQAQGAPGNTQAAADPQTQKIQAAQATVNADQAKVDQDNLTLSKLPANHRQDSTAVLMAQKQLEGDSKTLDKDQLQLLGDQLQQAMDEAEAAVTAAPQPTPPAPSQPPQNPFDPYGLLRKLQPDQV